MTRILEEETGSRVVTRQSEMVGEGRTKAPLLMVEKEGKRRRPVPKRRGETTALSKEKMGRREKARSLPSPPVRTAQRWKETLTEEVVTCIRIKNFSQEREESVDYD